MESARAHSSNAVVGNYRILRLLGRGGMGEVYLAEDARLKRQVALKLLPADMSQNPAALERFHREARAAAALHHPHICTIYEIGEAEGRNFIAMEYCEGSSLREHLDSKPMSIEEVLGTGIQMADAMEEARKKNIVHRDLKPSNIILSARGEVKILDFGLAKQVVQTGSNLSEISTEGGLTQSGMVMGTVAYMSPEQALGKQADHRSDIFSFGVTLYEMLTGKVPFTGTSSTEVLDSVLHKDPLPVARYNDKAPDALIRVVEKMLQKDPEDRYQSVHEVWSDLRRIKGESSTKISAVQAKPKSKRWIPFALAGMVVIFIASVLLFRKLPSQQKVFPARSVRSILALPCKVYGAKEMDYLTDAVPSGISTLLAQVGGLDTKMPPTSAEVERIHGDLNRLAEAYRVDSFLVSSVTAEPDHFLLSVQIVDAESKRVTWSKQYDGRPQNYIELTQEAAEGVRQTLRPSSPSITSAEGMARNSEAELAFRQGKYFSNRYNNLHLQEDFDKAFSAFKQSLDLDPRLADAAGEIAVLFEYQIESGISPERNVPEIQSWSARALQINGRCARAWVGLQAAEWWNLQPNVKKLLEFALKTVSSAPRDSQAHLAIGVSLEFTSVSIALQAYSHAHGLDPLYLYPPMNAAGVYGALGRADEGLSLIDNDVLRLEPDTPLGLVNKSLLLARLRRLKESGEMTKRLEEYAKEGRLPTESLLLAQHADALERGDDARAAGILKRILEISGNPSTSGNMHLVFVEAVVPFLASNRKVGPAVEILSHAMDAGVVPYDLLILNPDMKALRGDPGFEKVLAASRVKFMETLDVIRQARARGEFPQYLEKPLAELLAKLGIRN